jgi:hypothetical protein
VLFVASGVWATACVAADTVAKAISARKNNLVCVFLVECIYFKFFSAEKVV